MKINDLIDELDKYKHQICNIAQQIYDDWDENDVDTYANGGICHLIADEISSFLSSEGYETSTVTDSFVQHVYTIVKTNNGIFSVDIPYYVYETGGGFNWEKNPDVKFNTQHVVIDLIDNNPDNFDKYLDY